LQAGPEWAFRKGSPNGPRVVESLVSLYLQSFAALHEFPTGAQFVGVYRQVFARFLQTPERILRNTRRESFKAWRLRPGLAPASAAALRALEDIRPAFL
jgi:hypothetical protein